MKFKERIAQELKGSALSQKELAEKLHIDPANITNWKKGKNVPSIQVLFDLMKSKLVPKQPNHNRHKQVCCHG